MAWIVSIVAPAGGSATKAAPAASQRTSTLRPGRSAHPMAALPSVEVKRAVLATPTASRSLRLPPTHRTAERAASVAPLSPTMVLPSALTSQASDQRSGVGSRCTRYRALGFAATHCAACVGSLDRNPGRMSPTTTRAFPETAAAEPVLLWR